MHEQKGFNESVQISVKNPRRIASLMLCSQILYHLVGVEYIGPYLISPTRFTLLIMTLLYAFIPFAYFKFI